MDKGKPEYGKVYALTAFKKGGPSIANGNTWAESEVVEQPPRHGGPEDRGSADRYYGRAFDPHYYVGGSYSSERIAGERLTAEDRRQYKKGYEEQTEEKDWG